MGKVKEISIENNVEFLALADVKEHLRVTHSDDDAYISALIDTARQMIENFTERLYNHYNVVELYSDELINPDFYLSKRMPIAISSVEYTDLATEEASEIPSSNYKKYIYEDKPFIQLDSIPDYAAVPYPFQITYTAGIVSAEEIPAPVQSAALLIIGHLYTNRQDVVVGRQVNKMPNSSEYLLYPYRLF